MLYLILGLILFIFIIRKSNTDDLIKEANITTNEQKKEFEDKVIDIKSTKFSCLLLLACLLSIIVIAIIRHTSIELFFIQYFDNALRKEEMYIPLAWYALPFFIIVVRGIIVEVNIGDYIKKSYNLTEVEVDVKGEVKNLLVKKKTPTNESSEIETLDLTTHQEDPTTSIQTNQEGTTPTVEPVAPPVQQ